MASRWIQLSVIWPHCGHRKCKMRRSKGRQIWWILGKGPTGKFIGWPEGQTEVTVDLDPDIYEWELVATF